MKQTIKVLGMKVKIDKNLKDDEFRLDRDNFVSIPERLSRLGEIKEDHELMDNNDDICGLCNKEWNSEYHASDECITPSNEDNEVVLK